MDDFYTVIRSTCVNTVQICNRFHATYIYLLVCVFFFILVCMCVVYDCLAALMLQKKEHLICLKFKRIAWLTTCVCTVCKCCNCKMIFFSLAAAAAAAAVAVTVSHVFQCFYYFALNTIYLVVILQFTQAKQPVSETLDLAIAKIFPQRSILHFKNPCAQREFKHQNIVAQIQHNKMRCEKLNLCWIKIIFIWQK